jgi:hypothetical protein
VPSVEREEAVASSVLHTFLTMEKAKDFLKTIPSDVRYNIVMTKGTVYIYVYAR